MRTKTLILWLLLSVTIPSFAYDFQSGDLYYCTDSGDSTVGVIHNDTYEKLTSVIIPETVTYNGTAYSVTAIYGYAFGDCTGLTSITIPNSVTSIGDWTFCNCTGLTSVTIPDGVTTIGEGAFKGCTGLTSITIPNSVTSIGRDAFYNVVNIVYFGTATGSPWGAENKNKYAEGYLLYSDSTKTTLLRCNRTVTGKIIIPNSVTSIGEHAFSDCIGLTSITIPNGVTSIGNSAFSKCINLHSVTIPNSVTSIGDYAFKGCTYLRFVTIPNNSVTRIGSRAFSGCTHLRVVTIPNSVTSIGDGAFYGCTELTSVTIPHSVTTIGAAAFYGVHNIVYFYTADNYYAPWGAEQMNNGYVDGYLFYADAAKTTLLHCNHTVTGDIIIPNSVTSIEREAFYGCTGLTSITIPNGVTSIGNYAFYGCTGLTSVVWNAKNCQGWSQSDDSPFYVEKNKSSITSFTFGSDVKSIPSYLCYGMNKLTSVTIPNNITSIGSNAFTDCSRLTSITIPSSVREIGNSIVSGCRRLDTVVWNAKDCQGWSQYNDAPFYDEKGECSVSYFVFGNSVENIPSYLCYGMNVLSSVTIPNSVQTIGQNAFENCKYLEEVSLGMGIENIGENAFAGDSRIYSITCYADITPTIYESTFSGVSSNAELHVLANLVKKYKVNEYWGRFTIVPIGAENTTDGTLSVNPSETDATFTWPTNDNADTYTLTIQKGDVVFCILTFDANGVLQSMRFAAPSRYIAQHTSQAEATGNGFRFVVEGLDRATTYAYSITATDKDDIVLTNYSGTFTTQAPTGIEDILSTPSQPTTRKVFRNGQVYILCEDDMYNINGTKM